MSLYSMVYIHWNVKRVFRNSRFRSTRQASALHTSGVSSPHASFTPAEGTGSSVSISETLRMIESLRSISQIRASEGECVTACEREFRAQLSEKISVYLVISYVSPYLISINVIF